MRNVRNYANAANTPPNLPLLRGGMEGLSSHHLHNCFVRTWPYGQNLAVRGCRLIGDSSEPQGTVGSHYNFYDATETLRLNHHWHFVFFHSRPVSGSRHPRIHF